MPVQIELAAEPREVQGRRVKQMRSQGWIPAVVYGHHTAPRSLQIELRALSKVLARAGESRLISLQVAGGETPQTVLVREVQRDVLNHLPLHVDFYEVSMTEKLRATVPLHFVGRSPLVASGDALLNEALTEIEVECLPADLPESIEVDISRLTDFDAIILVKDLQVSSGVELLADPNEPVANLSAVREEVVEEEVAAPAEAAEVEVVAKGKAAKGEEEVPAEE
ncbi:MAG: 50S ribosomal protein L25 [Anaerolineae bacterium]|nr:50S ribosomal protein L25 [Anaerolineae bacterium]